jgi:hypothetical protein
VPLGIGTVLEPNGLGPQFAVSFTVYRGVRLVTEEPETRVTEC